MSKLPPTSSAMVSFRGPVAPDWVLAGLQSGLIPAVCLFNYNFNSLAELRALTDSLRAAAAAGNQPPPIIGIDQEGGQLMAVGLGATELPGNMALGASGDPELAREAGRVLARELTALGCNMNFAPVLDVIGDLDSHVVGLRAFSDDPELVARLGAALLQGLQENGILATAKHFPGHGRTGLDSHLAAPAIGGGRTGLDGDLVPFRAAISAGISAMMTAHVSYPGLDDKPATLSRTILTDLLRTELGFEGLVVTDAMDMHAVRHLPAEEAVTEAVLAGADLVLLGHLPDQDSLVSVLAGVTPAASVQRVRAARLALATEPESINLVGAAEHRKSAQLMADRSVTAVRGNPNLRLAGHEHLCLLTFRRGAATVADSTAAAELRLADQFRERHANLHELTAGPDESAADMAARIAALEANEAVIATEGASGDARQDELIRRLQLAGIDPVVLALRSPLDAAILHNARRVVCTYGVRVHQTEAAARLLFGEITASGELPVVLPPLGTVAA